MKQTRSSSSNISIFSSSNTSSDSGFSAQLNFLQIISVDKKPVFFRAAFALVSRSLLKYRALELRDIECALRI
jgi:hypothetical protein